MKKLLAAYKRARSRAKGADQSDWPWISQALLRHVDNAALDSLGLKPADRTRFNKANPVSKAKILGPYLQAAANADERSKKEEESCRLGDVIGAFKRSAKSWTQGIRFSPEKLYAMVKASPAKSLAFQLGGKTHLHFPLNLIRRILTDLKGLRRVTVDLMKSNNRLCFTYINEDGRPGHMKLVAHGMAEDPQKVLSVDLKPWIRPARAAIIGPVSKPVAVVAKPVLVDVPRSGGFMTRLEGWFQELAEDLG